MGILRDIFDVPEYTNGALADVLLESGIKSFSGTKFNPYHDSSGRFSSGSGGGAHLAPDTGGGSGGGGSGSSAKPTVPVTYNKDDKKWSLPNGKPVPEHIPRIPPAWTDVKVATSKNSSLLVTGSDAKGRSQSIYSAAHWAKAAETKFARVNELRTKVKSIQREIKEDVKNPKIKEEAACLRLVLETGIRPGGTGNTQAEKQAYGATTLEGRHVHVTAKGVSLQFVGKKGVDLDIPITSKTVANDLVRRKKQAGSSGKIFDTSEGKVLSYSKSKDGGSFKTKDFRTAKGTTTAIESMRGVSIPKNEKEYKKSVRAVAAKVAKTLGNTPVVALQSYIDPTVFSKWRASAGV